MKIWTLRVLNILAVLSGLALLGVDSPLGARLPTAINHEFFEAAPLLLVGVGFFVWLIMDRPAIGDLIKQGFIALAFVLWGIDLLLPAGPLATFVGAVVITIYVFDLAWLIEGSARKKFGGRDQ